MKKSVITFLLTLITAYLAVLVCLYVFQRNLIYVPNRAPALSSSEQRILTLETDDGLTLTSFFALPKIGEKTIVVMFHGNAGNISDRLIKTVPYIDQGYGAVIMGYRGYGGNAGKPSEAAFYADADLLMKTLIGQGHDPKDMILYGESLGTGVASKIATQYPVKAVIMEAPFTSLTDVAAATYPMFPVRALIKDHYDTMARLNAMTAPILFMYGTHDRVIPVSHSLALYDAYQGPKQLNVFEGADHVGLIHYGAGDVTVDFIKRLDQ